MRRWLFTATLLTVVLGACYVGTFFVVRWTKPQWAIDPTTGSYVDWYATVMIPLRGLRALSASRTYHPDAEMIIRRSMGRGSMCVLEYNHETLIGLPASWEAARQIDALELDTRAFFRWKNMLITNSDLDDAFESRISEIQRLP